ncbi:GNAT family N-acetyltransferase [Leekyejoonella antrihumi]|uniref:GNAT family N-acetyltransferase n=2 Tax=Leekyejoonella antrihumi TaxID=1660198 RepID=A0A563E817_9MICO|nr:GNAT family N-acetyltransferase [Leekyejoonella antrihumi]TWP38341.1 GNAT family N-acetyltransferase [Leekyejoonella antrihumi]
MTATEYDQWRPNAVSDYAEHHTRAGSMPADQAHDLAAKQFAELLPDGVATGEHHLLIPELDGTVVGFLWLHIPTKDPATFIYDIVIDEGMRGQGLGRQVMQAGETYARERGANSMKLHVFGENAVARHLYESLGYRETNVMMSKSLGT